MFSFYIFGRTYMRRSFTYRIVIAWFMLLVYTVGIFKIVQPYITYKINYNYISTVLCENKENPEMHCDGKCHLKKELKKAANEEKSQNNSSNGKSYESENISFIEIVLSPRPFDYLNLNNYPCISQSIIAGASDKTTPPPKS